MKCLTAKIINKGPLTDKEAEVLRYLCEGYYRPEIALKLHRTLSTVSSHVEHIAEKLHAHGSTEIVVLAEKLGLVEIKLIKPQHNYLLNSVLVFLMMGQLINPMGIRPPQTPRPAVRQLRRELS